MCRARVGPERSSPAVTEKSPLASAQPLPTVAESARAKSSLKVTGTPGPPPPEMATT